MLFQVAKIVADQLLRSLSISFSLSLYAFTLIALCVKKYFSTISPSLLRNGCLLENLPPALHLFVQ